MVCNESGRVKKTCRHSHVSSHAHVALSQLPILANDEQLPDDNVIRNQ
jgi:hypothetical protein